MRRLGPLYGGAVALVTSTPLRWPAEVADDDAARSPAWVVALGLPIGALAWLVAIAVQALGIPAPLAAIFGLAALTAGSAAIVERGVAERCRAWAGSPEVASVAISFLVLVRGAAIALVAPGHWLGVFVTAALAGRWAASFLQSIGDPVPPEAGRSLVATPAPMWLTGALSIAVAAIAIVALGKIGIVAIGFAALAVFGLGLDAQRRDGGLAPAVVATAAAVGELAVLLVATIG